MHIPRNTRVIIPEGSHIGVLVTMARIGLQDTPYGSKQQIVLTWELPSQKLPDDRSACISQTFSFSLNEKSSLYGVFSSWCPDMLRDPSPNWESLLGRGCIISIVHKNGTQGSFPKIASVSGLPPSTKAPKPSNRLSFYDTDDPDPKVLEDLPQWIRNKIESSLDAPEAPLEVKYDDNLPF